MFRDLRERVAILLDRDQRVLRTKLHQDLLLLGCDLRQHGYLLVRVAGAEADVHAHVKTVRPSARIHRHELIAKPDDTRLVLMFGDQVQDVLKQHLHAGLGKHAGDHLDLALRSRHRRGHGGCRCRLERVGIKAH